MGGTLSDRGYVAGKEHRTFGGQEERNKGDLRLRSSCFWDSNAAGPGRQQDQTGSKGTEWSERHSRNGGRCLAPKQTEHI